MTAHARVPLCLADPTTVFTVRCETRAYLYGECELTLHEAVDVLPAAAADLGLIETIGQDRVQSIMADAFRPIQDADEAIEAVTLNVVEEGLTADCEDSDDEYDGLTSSFARMCRFADAEHAHTTIEPRCAKRCNHVAVSTLRAARFLVLQGNPKRFTKWLAEHTATERLMICEHLKGTRDQSWK
jgi:hypothetical protein